MALWISNFPYRQSFDVLERPDNSYGLVEFVPLRYPGCGFFTHPTSSHTYGREVLRCRMAFSPTLRHLWFPKQPSFSTVINQAEQAMLAAKDPFFTALFESYRNQLLLAKEQDYMTRVADALRYRMKHSNHHHRYSTELKDTKHQIRSIEKRRADVAFKLAEHYTPQQMEAFAAMVERFRELMHVHHIWDMGGQNDSSERRRVFFDLGAFCYVCNPIPLPLMRNAAKDRYCLLPDRILRVRSPFDFDCYMLRDVEIRWGALGDGHQSELMIPKLNMLYRFTSEKRVEAFVQSWKNLAAVV